MMVGVNYAAPWNVYGIYLGSGNPPGSCPGMDVWPENLASNLTLLRDELGVRVVRVFLLGNAANYGSVVGGRTVLPEALDPRVTKQLELMFGVFADARMLVIPSLIDFKAFGACKLLGREPKQRTNGCTDRHDIVNDATIRRRFFDQVLRPFLAISKPFRNAVYAWEVQNEPIWNVSEFSLTSIVTDLERAAVGKTKVPRTAMQTFLQEAIDIIERFDVEPRFSATVGHRFARDLERFPTGQLRQFHYYPLRVLGLPLVDRSLPDALTTRAFLGEVAAGTHGDAWPELEGADHPSVGTRIRVRERLGLAERKGYPLTLLWPDIDGGTPFPGPDPLKFTRAAQQGIQDFQKLGRA
ncbi:MAG TPA: hypothetical protein VFU02_03020 [Polyangiaceae bacterium]|nr:hypothetical protein [Polyangiaceae bacterium]